MVADDIATTVTEKKPLGGANSDVALDCGLALTQSTLRTNQLGRGTEPPDYLKKPEFMIYREAPLDVDEALSLDPE
jgi:hypothetical protein